MIEIVRRKEGAVDFSIAFSLAIVVMVYFQFAPTLSILLLPAFILLTIITSLGIGFWFSSISVQYRDVAHALPFIVQILFWITPVGYAANKIPGNYQVVYWLNPIVCVIEGFRWSMLHYGKLPLNLVLLSSSVAITLFITGLMNFLRMERRFADVI